MHIIYSRFSAEICDSYNYPFHILYNHELKDVVFAFVAFGEDKIEYSPKTSKQSAYLQIENTVMYSIRLNINHKSFKARISTKCKNLY